MKSPVAATEQRVPEIDRNIRERNAGAHCRYLEARPQAEGERHLEHEVTANVKTRRYYLSSSHPFR